MISGRKGRQAIVVILHCSLFWKFIFSLVSVSCCAFEGETHPLARILEYKMEKMQILKKIMLFKGDCVVLVCTKMFKCYYVPRGHIDENYFCVLDRGS